VLAVAEIAWRQRTFAMQALPKCSGMPRDLDMGEISGEGDEARCLRGPASARPCRGVEEDLEVALTRVGRAHLNSAGGACAVADEGDAHGKRHADGRRRGGSRRDNPER
jgi:hypothetical protein